MSGLMQILVDLQRWVYGSITGYLDDFSTTGDWLSLTTVLPLGIVFGAVHALTPGHGKTVLASYLVGSRLAVARSVGVASVLSLTHVASAVMLALVGAPLLSRTITGAGRSETLEDVSRGLIALIGVWLVVRALRGKQHLHGEGFAIGFVAGLIPCPLTLFVMVLSLSRGIPEAGLTFAAAMLIGITLTLASVAVATTLGRDSVAHLIERYGQSMDSVAGALDALAGGLLILIGLSAIAG
jgi:ABC-type nickel/cobalt efflux system permease component RcnA